jgi:hypothetical protein
MNCASVAGLRPWQRINPLIWKYKHKSGAK